MSDLISRSELIKILKDRYVDHCEDWEAFKDYMGDAKTIYRTEMHECKAILDIIVDAPAVEVKSCVHGEWIPLHFGGAWMCSECDTLAYGNKATKFCSECGADMRG